MSKKFFLISLFLFLAYFATRLYNLMLMPLFTDEAIYVRWSQIARYDAGWRFISLTDGKQPSFVWLTMTVMKLVSDPLLAGRLVSVGAGLITLAGLYFLTKEIFKSSKTAFYACLIYLIFPMALMYDRMALYDSLVGAAVVWALYFEILLVRRLRLDLALILGMILGVGVLTKSSNFFSIYLLPFTLLLFGWKEKNKFKRLGKWFVLAGVAVVEAYGYYSILRLSPFFHIIGQKNNIFIFSFKEWVTHPWEFFYGNLLGLWDWTHGYFSWLVIFLIAGSFLFAHKYFKEKLLLFIWFVLPFTALALFGKVLYPRFIFFMLLMLIPLAALTMEKLSEVFRNKLIFIFLCFLLFFFNLKADFFILTDTARAPIPKSDTNQYINGWPAGGGIRETINFLEKQAEKKKIYVASEGTFGSLPTYAVEIYLGDYKNVEKKGIWPLPVNIPTDLLSKAKIMPVYLILNPTQDPPPGWPLKLIARYQKGISNTYLSLYQIR